MEILAPAGNEEQVIAAIGAGCDAVYGGFKKWNARQNAQNFDLKSYNKILEYCHERKVKFYLTLNILYTDDEISGIMEMLGSEEIELPDAIIAGDIGLILALRENIPNIPIHASTQFGASTLNDVRYLESIGVSRAILSRELNFSEIEYICSNSRMEIEVFVYGSQCVAFSGQCLLGGLIHNASGNRGRCISICRDIYKDQESFGYFLFPKDLNATSAISELDKIGVTSLKVEGRMRKPQEVYDVVSRLKRNKGTNEGYLGFLDEKQPAEGMISEINPRIKPTEVDTGLLSENDWIIDDDKLIPFGRAWMKNKAPYVKTVFRNECLIGNPNVCLNLKSVNGCLAKIECISSNGTWDHYVFSQNPNDSSKLIDVYKAIKEKLLVNVSECLADLPSRGFVRYNENELLKTIEEMNLRYARRPSDDIKKDDVSFGDEVYYVTCYEKVVELYKEHGKCDIIYEIEGKKELEYLLDLGLENDRIIYKLPTVEFVGVSFDMLHMLVGKRIIVTKMSQLWYINQEHLGYSQIIAHYSLNVWNRKGLEELCKYNVSGVVVHPELPYEYAIRMASEYMLQVLSIGMGYISAGYSRCCFGLTSCCKCTADDENTFSLFNEQKGYDIDVICSKNYNVRQLVPRIVFYSSRNNPDSIWITDIRVTDELRDELPHIELYRGDFK